MNMSEVNKGGRPREEPTNVRSVRLPTRVWKLVHKASKGSRSVNEYIQTISAETPSTGGNTGTEFGFPADRYAYVKPGRTLMLELSYKR